MVAVIVPTMNREGYVLRMVEYFAKMKTPHRIYIADYSEPSRSEALKQDLKAFDGKASYSFERLTPEDNATEAKRYLNLARRVREKYLCYCGDDDFQIPETLTACAEFLERNPDYSLAMGHGILFSLDENAPYHGPLKTLSDYPTGGLEHDSALERLRSFYRNYHVNQFGVCRLSDYLHCIEQMEDSTDRLLTAEVLHGGYFSLIGKTKLFRDRVGIVRQHHEERHFLPKTQKWLESETFKSTYPQFLKVLGQELQARSQLDLNEAKIEVEKAFQVYLDHCLALPSEGPTKSNLRERLGLLYTQLKRQTLGQKFQTSRSKRFIQKKFPETHSIIRFLETKSPQ